MIYAYIRVSTDKQDLGNQRNTILEYANAKKIFIDEFIEVEMSSRKARSERKVDLLLSKLNKDDTLIVTEISRLGRSISDVLSTVNHLIETGIRFVSIKESIDLKDKHSMQSKITITMFSLFGELERDLISLRTTEALAAKRAAGIRLGRPKGCGKSKLDPHVDQIKEFLGKGVSIASIAKILGCSYPTVFHFVKRKQLHPRHS